MTKETGIKPVFFLKGKRLFVRYTVDRAVELSTAEESKLKADMSMNPADKQSVLAKAWNFMTACVGKAIIMDGVAVAEQRRFCPTSLTLEGLKRCVETI